MSRVRKIAAIVAAAIFGPLLIGIVAAFFIVQTDFFRNFVREKLISTVEDATGGKVDVRAFDFEWQHLRATVRDFVIHGTEPSGAAPLFRASLLQVDLKLLSPFKGMVDIESLLVDQPQANVIVFPDGRTNIPAPKIKKQSDKSGLETVVDLAIRHFDLRNGSLTFAERKSAFDARGQNLRAHLDYNIANPSYVGEVDVNPLNLAYGTNPPVDVNVKLPVRLEKDRVTLSDARLTTPESELVVTASMDHLTAPRTTAHINGSIALAEVKRVAGLSTPLDTVHGPGVLHADITAYTDDTRTEIRSAQLNLGSTRIQASGTLKDEQKPGQSLQYNANLAVGELGRLLRLDAKPEGNIQVNGNAALRANNDYLVTANVTGRNLAFQQGTTRLAGISVDSSVTADPHRIELGGVRLTALGGSLTGSGALENMAQFRFSGNLHNFDIQQVAKAFMPGRIGYDGIVSGPIEASGNIHAPSAIIAKANLAVAPGHRGGVPVSGRINADYNGRADTVTLGRSYLALPSSRVDLSGSLGQQVQLRLVSHNLNDFRPLMNGPAPVTLNRGSATVTATVSGNLSAPRITGHIGVSNFAVEGRQFDSLNADLAATRSGASISNAVVARGPMQTRIDGSVGMRNWKLEPREPLRADATIRNADMRDLLALAGQASVPVSGAVVADGHLTGTVGDPRGQVAVTVTNGTAYDEHFDQLLLRANFTEQAVDIPTLQLTAGPSRIDGNAQYQHAPGDLKRGVLRAHVGSNQIELEQLQALVKDRPGLGGRLSLLADATATVQPVKDTTDIQLTALNANASARGLRMQGKNLGDFTATANTVGSELRYAVNSDFAGSTIRVNGQSLLTGNHNTQATASIANLPIDQVLAIAGRRDLPVSGIFAANAKVSGTLQDPHASGTFSIAKGSAYQEPFDRLQATVTYDNRLVDVPDLRLTAGPSSIELGARFVHPAGNLQQGNVQFRVKSNRLQLARFHTVQQQKPGLAGTLEIAAEGAATLRQNATPGVLFSNLNANIAATGLSVNKKPVGDLTASAQTRGTELVFNLNSDLGHSDIKGNGRMQLTGDYPVDAQVTFNRVTYSGLSPLIGGEPRAEFDASMDGRVTVAGPVTRTDAMRGRLELTRLEAHSQPAAGMAQPRTKLEIHNAGPIVAALDHNVVTVQSAQLTGPHTKLTLAGTANVSGTGPINLKADGNIQLDVLQAFDPNIFSSGSILLNAAVTGTTSKPLVNGRLELQNASFNMLDMPNGLTNGNGTIVFSGTEAVIQNVTGESGGGKVTVAGFVGYGGPEMNFRVQATADKVRVEATSNVSAQFDAKLTLLGTESRSLVSGNVTVLDLAMHSHSDIGSMLNSAATPPASPESKAGLLAGMRFDVRIETAPDVQFRTTLTQNLQAEAHLNLRGSAARPGMLGRVTVTEGEIVFFGYRYTIQQGSVAFYDPNKVNPILNINLQTNAKGVDVTLTVAGPMDRLKLTYHSDPPLQFSEIVSLLASGKVPTSDPVLAAQQPVAPQQSFEQMGASTLLGQAVANPVAGRLQRLFGVSKLKIDPQIIGQQNTPAARFTIEQQISRNLIFTYIQDVTRSNPQVIRIEWAIDRQWSAIAMRQENGEFGLDVFYKKRFW